MRTPAQNGKRSREKGKRGEREAAKLLRDHGIEAIRGQQNRGGGDSPDVRVQGIPIHVEVKRTQKINVYKAMAQADNDADLGMTPIVLHRRDGERWLAIVDATVFLDLLRRNFHDRV